MLCTICLTSSLEKYNLFNFLKTWLVKTKTRAKKIIHKINNNPAFKELSINPILGKNEKKTDKVINKGQIKENNFTCLVNLLETNFIFGLSKKNLTAETRKNRQAKIKL